MTDDTTLLIVGDLGGRESSTKLDTARIEKVSLVRAAEVLADQPGVTEVDVAGCVLSCLVQGPRRVNAALVRALVEAGLDVTRAVPERENLEALFLTVTRGELQ